MKKNIGRVALLLLLAGLGKVEAWVYISPERLEYIKEQEERATQAEEKVAVKFPDFTVQCQGMEVTFPFLRGNENWNKVKTFLMAHAGKQYHRNPADRRMLVDLFIAIENGETRDQQILSMNSRIWNSFWQEILNAAFKNVF